MCPLVAALALNFLPRDLLRPPQKFKQLLSLTFTERHVEKSQLLKCRCQRIIRDALIAIVDED
jgi:hypothetical protein